MRWLLVALGWLVCALALGRAARIGADGLWVRALMTASWALLAAGVAITAMYGVHQHPWVRWLWAVALGIGTGAFALGHVAREQV